jgi:hypothetical protein
LEGLLAEEKKLHFLLLSLVAPLVALLSLTRPELMITA